MFKIISAIGSTDRSSRRMKAIDCRRFIVVLTVWVVGCTGASGPVVPGTDETDEQIRIAGHVAAEDGSPIARAEIVLEPLSLATLTDGEGAFTFTFGPPGVGVSSYVLEVRSEGYETMSLQVTVGSGETTEIEVILKAISGGPDPGPEPGSSGIVVTSFTEDAAICIAAGVELSYTVKIANEGGATVEGVVLHDTLDTGFSRDLSASDIVVDRSTFPDAVVLLNPDGRSFRVEVGIVPSMNLAEVYTVTLPAGAAGVFCNRVSALMDGDTLLASDSNCVADLLVIEIDLVNEDGAIAGGVFSPGPEVFHVGDGGADRPDALVYRILVANHHCGSLGSPQEEVSLSSFVGARSGAVELREILPGFPSRGSVVSSSTGGFVWSIGTLAPGEETEIRFRAEAIRAGDDVHRVELTVPQLTGTIVNEEPVTILP